MPDVTFGTSYSSSPVSHTTTKSDKSAYFYHIYHVLVTAVTLLTYFHKAHSNSRWSTAMTLTFRVNKLRDSKVKQSV